jgi:hypothetical protein
MTTSLEIAGNAAKEYSGLASETARKLAFAGIAVIWVFRTEVDKQITLEPKLLAITCLFVAALAFDLLHYVSSAAIWTIVFRVRELQSKTDPTAATRTFRPWWNWPAYFLFWAKLALTVFAYIALLSVLVSRLRG